MKYIIGLFFVLWLILSSGVSVTAAPTDPVTIPDAVLRSRIEDALNKSAGATITEADMATLTTLRADREHDIRELTGLEYAVNLKTLVFLRGIPQTRAQLFARPFWRTADLAPLKKLTKLEWLAFEGIVIFDMTPIVNLTSLRALTFNYTYGITRIPDLSNLTELLHLRLLRNEITDISGVRGLTKLQQLDLGLNRNLSDITPLTQLRNLEILRLDQTLVTRESLSAVLPFMSPDIDQMQSTDFPLISITSGEFGITGTNISDLSVLDNFPNVFLHALYLQFMGSTRQGTYFFHLKDLTPLVKLMNKPKLINSKTNIYLQHNYGLDYPSFYEEIPALIAGSRSVRYVENPNPQLEREFPKGGSYEWLPGSPVTFKVRAVNTNPDFPANFLRLTPDRTTGENRQFAEVPVTWKVTAPDGTVSEQKVPTGDDGLSSFTFTLGNDGERHTVEAIVPAKTNPQANLSHGELKVEFTATAVAPPVIQLTLYCEGTTQTNLQWIAEVSGTLPEAYVAYHKKSVSRDWIEAGSIRRGARKFSFIHSELQPSTSYDLQLFALKNGRRFGTGSNVLTARTLSPGANPTCPTAVAPPVQPPKEPETPPVDPPDEPQPPVKPPVEQPPEETPIDPPVDPPEEIQPPVKQPPEEPDPVDPPVEQLLGETPVDPPEEIQLLGETPVDPPEEIQLLGETPVKQPVEPPLPYRPPIPLGESFIFNEIGNFYDNTNDWIELKNVCNTPIDLSEWQIRLITTDKIESGAEIDIVSLPDFVLPAQGLLLVANTDPSENHLASGLNIATGARQKGVHHLYFVAPDLRLPNTPFLLILQQTASADKNPTIEDVAGNYFWEVLPYDTEVYPFVYPLSEAVALHPQEKTAPLTEFGAWQRQHLEEPGYLAKAWIPSRYHAHLGYDRHAPTWVCLGTPGYLYDPSPSQPVTHRLVFNEIRNASDDTNDWIELKNVCGTDVRLRDWNISIVASPDDLADQDADIISFPDYILPMDGVLLITNTDPNKTVVASGLNIATGKRQAGAQHPYFVASNLKLPSTPYLLILRYVQEKDGDIVRTIEDAVGNYTWPVLYDSTEVYPHSYKPYLTEAKAPLTEFGAWQRQRLEEPGYLAKAWIPSGYHTHLGYDRHAPASMCLGTPGYLHDPSPVLPIASRVVFNKIRNASDDTNDWIELKNLYNTDVRLRDWEVSIVASTGKYADQDVYIVSFPDYTLPVGGVLLITNTDPDKTVIVDGLNIAPGERQQQGARHPYLVDQDLKLPSTPYLLILRHARGRNGTPEAIEDVAGNYFRTYNYTTNYTEVWPLDNTQRPSVPAPPMSEVGNWQRKNATEHGYLATAWTVNQSPPGIGSAPNALEDGENVLFASNANAAAVVFNPNLPDEIRITELMSETKGDTLPQWIELYNASQTPVNLKGWQLDVETRTDRTHQHATLTLKPLVLPPKQTLLLVTAQGESSDALPTERIYDLSETHRDLFSRHLKNTLIGTEGFSLKLLHPTGRVVDRVGNLDGDKDTDDQPTWTLPDSMTPQGHRFSLLRRFDGDVLKGTKASGWMSAVSVAIGVNAYYGDPTDIATPGFLHQIVPGTSPTVALSISETLFETKTRTRPLPQWIELYNPSFTNSVKLKDCQLIVETLQEGNHQNIVITLEAFDVLPNQTALIVTGRGVHSKHLPDNRTYNLFQRHPKAFLSLPHRSRLLSSEGFLIQLTDATGNVIDTVGNLDGQPHTKDTPTWELPPGETSDGERASIRRLYNKRVPLDGRYVKAWVSTADVPPKIITYYGHASDVGNPMYRKGTPLPVTLSSFKATRTADGNVIHWTTESEVNNAGFNILRSRTKTGEFQKINAKLIQGAGTTGKRTTYAWTDTTAKPNTVYYYRIEDVSHAGVHQTLTTTRLRGLISPKGKMITQWVSLK